MDEFAQGSYVEMHSGRRDGRKLLTSWRSAEQRPWWDGEENAG